MIKIKKYDLEERTTRFSESLIDICKACPKNTVTIPIIDQLIRSGTSIGANYFEANRSSSKKDFKNKIFICKKESKETQYWLRILARSFNDEIIKSQLRKLWQEAKEFSMNLLAASCEVSVVIPSVVEESSSFRLVEDPSTRGLPAGTPSVGMTIR